MIFDPGMPRRVLAKAQEIGVHNDCLISVDLCPACHTSVVAAFDFFYGDCADEAELILAVISDFRQDIIDDQMGRSSRQ